ncbi:MAG: hypothetical protein J6V90_07875 [Treponema sp.]|nr:hypothetical protein [Treponema sp.]
MDFNPCIPRIRATAVAVAAGVTTVTLPATPTIEPGEIVDILLATAIPDGTDGTQITITNGTVTGSLMNGNGNYLRPYPLNSRIVIRAQFLSDPAHFQIVNIFGRGFRRVCS